MPILLAVLSLILFFLKKILEHWIELDDYNFPSLLHLDIGPDHSAVRMSSPSKNAPIMGSLHNTLSIYCIKINN